MYSRVGSASLPASVSHKRVVPVVLEACLVPGGAGRVTTTGCMSERWWRDQLETVLTWLSGLEPVIQQHLPSASPPAPPFRHLRQLLGSGEGLHVHLISLSEDFENELLGVPLALALLSLSLHGRRPAPGLAAMGEMLVDGKVVGDPAKHLPKTALSLASNQGWTRVYVPQARVSCVCCLSGRALAPSHRPRLSVPVCLLPLLQAAELQEQYADRGLEILPVRSMDEILAQMFL